MRKQFTLQELNQYWNMCCAVASGSIKRIDYAQLLMKKLTNLARKQIKKFKYVETKGMPLTPEFRIALKALIKEYKDTLKAKYGSRNRLKVITELRPKAKYTPKAKRIPNADPIPNADLKFSKYDRRVARKQATAVAKNTKTRPISTAPLAYKYR